MIFVKEIVNGIETIYGILVIAFAVYLAYAIIADKVKQKKNDKNQKKISK
jgi:hypothetical protein